MDEPTTHAPETVAHKQRRLFGGGRDTDRIVFFSDAVFAIALTLLVLDVRLPADLPRDDLLAAVLGLWPELLGYTLSFVIIAINWVSHHRKFRVILRYDTRLIWINLLFLFFVALVPFPTSVLSEHAPQPAAVVLYAASVSVLGLAATLLWWYARHAGLMSGVVDRGLFAYSVANTLVAPAVFLLSIPIALLADPVWAMWFWALIYPLSLVVARIWGRHPAEPDADEPVKD